MPAVLARDAHALEGLQALARALDHLDVDPQVSPGPNSGIGRSAVELGDLLLLELLDQVHRIPPCHSACRIARRPRPVAARDGAPTGRAAAPRDRLSAWRGARRGSARVPREQHLRAPRGPPLRRPRVVRIFEQAAGEALLLQRRRAPITPGSRRTQASISAMRRRLAARQHEVAEADLLERRAPRAPARRRPRSGRTAA